MADGKKDVAQVQFAKLQREQDGRKAMSEYEAEGIRLRANTERLRALRLAREAQDAASAPVVAPKAKSAAKSAAKGVAAKGATAKAPAAKGAAKKAPKAGKTAKAAAGKLEDWLEGQQGSGRRS